MPRIAWENNILGFIPKTDWLDIPFQISRPGDPADRLIGDQKTANLVAEWESIASEYQIPVMAQFHGFDTEALTTFRVPIDTHNIEKGLIKVKINQTERMRALLRSGVQGGDMAMYDYVINDGVRLAEQVVTRTKVAKNELLSTGKITIKENNLNLTVDYGVPANQTGLTLDLSEGADVPAQIQAIIDFAQEKGVILTGIYTSGAVISKLRKNVAIQKALNGVYGTGALISRGTLETYLAEEFGIGTVITNDLTYGKTAAIGADGRPVISTARYFPKNTVTFFAANVGGRLGTGLWGDSPEADVAQLMQVSQSGLNPYIYISQWTENDPAVLWTKASTLFMPVLYNPNSLFIATVADDFLDPLTIAPESQGNSMWEVPVSSIQGSDVAVANGAVTGTLKYLSGSNAITNVWGPGNFLALNWTSIDPKATSLKVGLEPSAGSGLVEAIGDSDHNGIFKVTNKNVQKVKFVLSDGTHSRVQMLDLSGLTLQTS